MDNKILLMVTLIALLIVPSVSASIEYTGTTKTECSESGRCYTTFYGGTMFAQNSQGEWVSPTDVLSITKSQDDITFHYDGINGDKSITFEAGVIYNGTYYSMSQVKQMKPDINFNFPHEDKGSYYKYAVNITNLGELNIDLIENITLTYKSHEGFNLNQLKTENNRFKITSILGLYFDDLIKLHPISINVAEKRLYISNITDNIIDGELYLDPTLLLETADSEITNDAFVLERLPNANRGTLSTMNIPELEVTDQIIVSYIQFNITGLPVNINILWANLSIAIETNNVQDFNITATGVNNQTWKEDIITWNKQPTGVQANPINNAFTNNSAFTARWPLNVTEWVVSEHGKTFVSFLLNGTTSGLAAGGCTGYTKEWAVPASRPWLNITYELQAEISAGINITVLSAVDGASDITSWDVTFNNGTDIVTSVNNNNPTVINVSDLPTGSGVNVTIFKAGFGNATYNVSINDTHIENLTTFIFTTSRGLIDIFAPVNGSSVAGTNLFLNVTSPDNITGILNNVSYELNSSGNFITLCNACANFSGVITLGGFGAQNITVRATSSTYNSWFVTSIFSNLFGTYDLLIMDELRNVTFDWSLVEFANLTAFCPTTELNFDITKNLTETIDIGCDFDYIRFRMKLHNQSIPHFRTLIPEFSDTLVTFYMMDNITRNPDTNTVDLKLIIEDLTGNFLNGIVHIKKAINGSIVDIIDKQTDAQGAIDAYLILNERYRLSIESADGRITKTLGDLIIRSLSETEIVLRISELDIFPPLVDFITWRFIANQTELFINFTYNDTLFLTNSVTFNVYNITDPTDRVLLFTETQNVFNASFSFTGLLFNNTYLAEFVADHQIFGEISETRIFIFTDRLFPIGLFELEPIWYQIISIFLIMMTALLFGARAAPWGVVVVAIEAGFFVLVGWLDLSIPIMSLVALLAVLSAIGYRRREQ